MPRLRKVCSWSPCPELVTRPAYYCPAHQRPMITRPSPAAQGYGRGWRAARLRFLASHPLCFCGAPATVVDHVVPHKGDMVLFWTESNLAALCVPHHAAKTAASDGGYGNKVLG